MDRSKLELGNIKKKADLTVEDEFVIVVSADEVEKQKNDKTQRLTRLRKRKKRLEDDLAQVNAEIGRLQAMADPTK